MNRTILVCGVMTACLLCFGQAKGQSHAHQMLQQLAEHQLAQLCGDCTIRVTPKWIPPNLEQADAGAITGLQFADPGLPRGYQAAAVTYRREKGAAGTAQVQLHVQVQQRVPVLTRRIERDEIVGAQDVILKMRDITRLPSLPLTAVDAIAGKAARGMLRKGQPVWATDLHAAPVIRVGDSVEMIYNHQGLQVAIHCTARQARGVGEQIRLHSEETRRTYLGKVITPTKVIWEKTL